MKNNVHSFVKYRKELFGVATLMILLCHSVSIVPFPDRIGTFISYGTMGVNVFLFLSGIGLYYSFNKNGDIIAFYKKRFMRVIVFFDLPTETDNDRRNYRHFRKSLIREGFMMMQMSVYVKLALNSTQVNQIIENVKKIKPEKGLVQILTVTEKQFSKMELISGKCNSDVVNTDERLLIL